MVRMVVVGVGRIGSNDVERWRKARPQAEFGGEACLASVTSKVIKMYSKNYVLNEQNFKYKVV